MSPLEAILPVTKKPAGNPVKQRSDAEGDNSFARFVDRDPAKSDSSEKNVSEPSDSQLGKSETQVGKNDREKSGEEGDQNLPLLPDTNRQPDTRSKPEGGSIAFLDQDTQVASGKAGEIQTDTPFADGLATDQKTAQPTTTDVDASQLEGQDGQLAGTPTAKGSSESAQVKPVPQALLSTQVEPDIQTDPKTIARDASQIVAKTVDVSAQKLAMPPNGSVLPASGSVVPDSTPSRDRRDRFAINDFYTQSAAKTGLQNGDALVPKPVASITPVTALAASGTAGLESANSLDIATKQDFVAQTSLNTPSTTPTSLPGGHVPSNYAPQVASQIATALVQANGGTTEISLNPEELGRVRIALTASEGGLSVSILAERPETADLMRRNLDALAKEFAELGYENLTFDFGDNPDDASEKDDSEGTLMSIRSNTLDADAIASQIPTAVMTGGLDLKL